jgi:uncharacterized membrane protein YhaH (DUF805 family)
MSFRPSRSKSLITLLSAMLLFGLFLAVVVKARSTKIFVATATYAAVLVVFLATSGTTGINRRIGDVDQKLPSLGDRNNRIHLDARFAC